MDEKRHKIAANTEKHGTHQAHKRKLHLLKYKKQNRGLRGRASKSGKFSDNQAKNGKTEFYASRTIPLLRKVRS